MLIDFLLRIGPFPVRIKTQTMEAVPTTIAPPTTTPLPTTTTTVTTTISMRCSEPVVGILSSGTNEELPKTHYVTESVQVEAEISIQCEDSVVQYRWTVVHSNSTVEKYSGTVLRSLSIPEFGLSVGINSVCIEVTPVEPNDFHSQTDCRHFEVKRPDIVAGM